MIYVSWSHWSHGRFEGWENICGLPWWKSHGQYFAWAYSAREKACNKILKLYRISRDLADITLIFEIYYQSLLLTCKLIIYHYIAMNIIIFLNVYARILFPFWEYSNISIYIKYIGSKIACECLTQMRTKRHEWLRINASTQYDCTPY